MDRIHSSRRSFLRSAVAAAGAAVAAPCLRFDASHAALAAGDGQRPHPLRLGGPVFNMPRDPEGMALAHRKLGYRAAYCPGVGLNDKERIRDIAAAFAKHDVVLAEVGRWVNLLDADPAKRAANRKLVTEGLALAEEIGARCCVDIAGSYNRKVWYGPDPGNLSQKFLDEIVENARKIIDAVKPKRARFTYEAMGWAIPDGPDSYLKLIKAVDRAAFGVHLDVCNMINCPKRFYNTTALINECFDKLGPWIVSCHAKDLTWDVEMNIHFRETTIGEGSIDFVTYLKRVAALPGDATLMIEHMAGPAEYDKSRKHLFALGRKNGIAFE